MNDTNYKLPETAENYLRKFAAVADEWFQGRPFVVEYHRFIQNFFNPENLEKAEWADFQKLANQIHSLNSLAIAKGNAFGKPNYSIEKYRESFLFLANGDGSVEERMRAFLSDNEKYASKFLGPSVVSEIIGQLFADKFIFMNGRDVKAADFLEIFSKSEAKGDFPSRFIQFNHAIQPLFAAYGQIVTPRTQVPIGLEVDQFLSWIYETHISDEKPELVGRQIWSYAPGRKAKYWNECVEQSIAVLGGDLLGPFTSFNSKDEIISKFKELYSHEGEPTNLAVVYWTFCNSLKDGDFLIAKNGNRRIVGIGVVRGDYRFDPDRAEYKHVRDVEWLVQGDWPLPEGESFTTKSLTNITKSREFLSVIGALTGINFEGDPPSDGANYFWLNCSPQIWRVSEQPVNAEQFYTTHNEEGNKRQVYVCFGAVRPGDLMIAYETSPIQKATTILEVTQGIHHEPSGECIRFKTRRHLESPRTLQDLRAFPALKDCELIQGNRQGSLFRLTKAEFDAIVSDDNAPPPPEPPPAPEYPIEDALDGLFIDATEFKSWLGLWNRRKNLIIQGPPGVGKTFVARRLA